MDIEERLIELEKKVNLLQRADPRKRNRYPYTFACDYIRENFDIESRAEAAKKMDAIARILGEYDGHERVAIAFAESFLQSQEE